MGQGTPEPNPRTGTFLELPQNRDTLCNDAWGRTVPVIRESPLPGGFRVY